MKKIGIFIFGSFIIFAILLSCRKNEPLLSPSVGSPNEQFQGEFDETYYYGQYHNDAVNYLVEEYEAEAENIAKGDTAALIAFLISKMESYYETHPLVLNNEELELPNLDYSSNMLNFFRNGTEHTSPYLDSMISSITTEPSYSEIRGYVDYAYQVALDDNSIEQSQKDIELAVISLFKGSLDLWYNHSDVPAGKRYPVAEADLGGVVAGAYWGSVAGPLGSVVIGINGGIIASSCEYIMDRWWNSW